MFIAFSDCTAKKLVLGEHCTVSYGFKDVESRIEDCIL